MSQWQEEVAALSSRPVVFQVDVPRALVVVGALQLATRHPNLPSNSKKVVLDFIQTLTDALSPDPNGPIAQVIELGFNPVYDEPPDT